MSARGAGQLSRTLLPGGKTRCRSTGAEHTHFASLLWELDIELHPSFTHFFFFAGSFLPSHFIVILKEVSSYSSSASSSSGSSSSYSSPYSAGASSSGCSGSSLSSSMLTTLMKFLPSSAHRAVLLSMLSAKKLF